MTSLPVSAELVWGAPTDMADDATIQGYVIDNMEGAVDQAAFLALTDMPIAVVGPRGTGKMYIAKVVHQSSACRDGAVRAIDCREFRNREEALRGVRTELEAAEGSTLVFKSPHLMAPEAQNKLARQLSTRVLADSSPPCYLPRANFIALFPDSIEQLLRSGALTERLASAFGGFPINVPPLKDRRRAVLRWARKILGQESSDRGRQVKGFSPEAEKAMLGYDWPGNITEMRQRIVAALDSSEREWLTPVDLGIYSEERDLELPSTTEVKPFLAEVEEPSRREEEYSAPAIEQLDLALAEAVNRSLSRGQELPLGTWLGDDLVLAVLERYQHNSRASADFLHTRPRNISRWLPRIEARKAERSAAELWAEPRRLVYRWIREIPVPEQSPLELAESLLLEHLESHTGESTIKDRAFMLGVSIPTYQKKLKQRQ